MNGDNLNRPQVSLSGVLGPSNQVQNAMSKLNQVASGNGDAIDKLMQAKALNNLVDNSSIRSSRNPDVATIKLIQQRTACSNFWQDRTGRDIRRRWGSFFS